MPGEHDVRGERAALQNARYCCARLITAEWLQSTAFIKPLAGDIPASRCANAASPGVPVTEGHEVSTKAISRARAESSGEFLVIFQNGVQQHLGARTAFLQRRGFRFIVRNAAKAGTKIIVVGATRAI